MLFLFKRGSFGPVLCTCFLVYRGGRSAERVMGFVGVFHMCRQLCEAEQDDSSRHSVASGMSVSFWIFFCNVMLI